MWPFKRKDYGLPIKSAQVSEFGRITVKGSTTGLLFVKMEDKPVIVASFLDNPAVYALSLDGKIKWEYDTQNRRVNCIEKAVIEGYDAILVGTDRSIHVIDQNGVLIWKWTKGEDPSADALITEFINTNGRNEPFNLSDPSGENFGIVSLSSGKFGNDNIVIAFDHDNSTQFYLLNEDASGYTKTIPGFFSAILRKPQFTKLEDNGSIKDCVVGLTMVGGGLSLPSVGYKFFYNDGKNFVIKGQRIDHLLKKINNLDSGFVSGPNIRAYRDKPRWAFIVETIEDKTVVISGMPLERYIHAFSIDGEEIWGFDTSVGAQSDKQWGIWDVAIGRLEGKGAVVVGAVSGLFSILGSNGEPRWQERLQSRILNVAHTSYNGVEIFAAGLSEGILMLFNEGESPLKLKPEAEKSFPCIKCGKPLVLDVEKRRLRCDNKVCPHFGKYV